MTVRTAVAMLARLLGVARLAAALGSWRVAFRNEETSVLSTGNVR